MEQQVAVLYKGKIAHYSIQKGKNACFVARLLRYNGNNSAAPPSTIELCKEGRHWTDDDADPNLVDDIGLAIEHASKSKQTSVKESGENESKDDSNEDGSPS